jgi:hypothetical protein
MPTSLLSRVLIALAGTAALLIILQVRSCEQARQKAAESRLEKAQGKAVVQSAKDSIATQATAQAREQASEQMTSENTKEIRDAKGADAKVDPAVSDAGLRSLCRRPAYRSSERCRLLRADPE